MPARTKIVRQGRTRRPVGSGPFHFLRACPGIPDGDQDDGHQHGDHVFHQEKNHARPGRTCFPPELHLRADEVEDEPDDQLKMSGGHGHRGSISGRQGLGGILTPLDQVIDQGQDQENEKNPAPAGMKMNQKNRTSS